MRIVLATCLSLVLVAMLSCLPEPLPVGDVPQLKPKIVVSSQITTNQSLLILLTKSIGALEASEDSDPEELLNELSINDAIVTLSHGEEEFEFFFLGNGLYATGQLTLIPGHAYSLRIESASMGTVTSSTEAKERVEFEYSGGAIYDNGYDTLAEIAFSFVDPPGKNYYMLNVQRLTDNYEAENILNPEIFTELLDDETFEQSTYSGRKRVLANRDFVPGDTVGIFLSNISKEYYDFMQIRIDSRFNFAEFLGEPANYPSNIKGGLGFFNLYIPEVVIEELEGPSPGNF